MFHTIDLNFLGVSDAIASFLIETEKGLVLIESGPYSTFPKLAEAIQAKGFAIEDIQHVLLTHIHLDHAGAAWAFAEKGAQIYVHPLGAKHLSSPGRLMASARKIYQDDMDRLWGDMRDIPEDQVNTVQNGEILDFGNVKFTAWHTPGHAVHHIAWEWDNRMFTGDVAGVRIGQQSVCPPCPPPDIDLHSWQESINLIKDRNPETLYLTHYGEVTDITAHLAKLEAKMHAWADWIKPHWENNRKPEDCTAAFQAYVQQQLLEEGVKEEDLPKYEAANPSWMSVAGLMRYWRLKSEGRLK